MSERTLSAAPTSSVEIAQWRIGQQHLSRPTFGTPTAVVSWFGAVQAQEYLPSLWAVALRMPDAMEATIERAIAERAIVRSWPMRCTIHYMAAADARWMLELLAPRALPGINRRLAALGIDERTVARAADVVQRSLAGDRQLPRPELYAALEQAGIPTGEMRGLHLMVRLAHDRLICFGPRIGKQASFALLDEWLPAAPTLQREEALAELARRYFASHGPATLHDFAWWSSLTIADARRGLEQVSQQLATTEYDGRAYWHAPDVDVAAPPPALLLPYFDELYVAYKDRSAGAGDLPGSPAERNIAVLNPTVVVGGQAVGGWKRTLRKDGVTVTLQLARRLTQDERAAVAAAAERYGRFLGLPATVEG